ncbi:hypothetical protein SAMN05518865_10850 [Duganella sp. CF458]|uniref:hypothetical protein n=1 Tax=Duganella sp. CF458 TaxID=1884368 RepID=UPI0008F30043|nr:hypothetical protein [Duganella sp. CF458]SFG08153.1 hypothetical protein SAMN05518865_10850 [Duganella sp. CF458]
MEVFASLAGFLGISYPGELLIADARHRPEQVLIIHFQYGSCDLSRVFEVVDRIRKVLAKAGAGEYRGNDAAPDGSAVFLHFYGRDADQLLRVIEPILEEIPFLRGAEVKKRIGPAAGAVIEVMPRIGSK